MFIADLHIHSRYSRATARNCDLEHLSLWAQKKGLGVVGTGDITHPAWRAELREKLVAHENGLFALRTDIAQDVARELPPACRSDIHFILTGEISTIYKYGERTRKVHHLIILPSLDAAERMAAKLARIGNITSDGRPILGLDSRDLLEIVLECDPRAFLIPAHIWTPWFSALGSKSGFDSIEECYRDLASHIFAVETGLSSDPAMNWRVSSLDRYRLVSNSDAHSPQKLGREATLFSCSIGYDSLKQALQTGEGYVGTIEFFPEEGKYHLDGHRACHLCWHPEETRRQNERCSICGKPVTVGVLHRVIALADRHESCIPPKTAGRVISLIPLQEILGELLKKGPQTKSVLKHYDQLLEKVGPELTLLTETPPDVAGTIGPPPLAEGLQRLRAGKVRREGGYDGAFGRIKLFDEGELE